MQIPRKYIELSNRRDFTGMKNISFLLIFCLLLHDCISMPTGFIVAEVDELRKEKLRVKDCTFKEILEQRFEKYGRYHLRPFVIGLGVIDLAVGIQYYLRVNPVGFHLYLNGLYTVMAGFMFTITLISYNEKINITFYGWEHLYAAECKADYFVLAYSGDNYFKRNENFIYLLVSYSEISNPSNKKNFEKLITDFVQNNQIIIHEYTEQSRFFRYFYYRGGKKKFKEDFQKYLDKHSD